MEDKKKARARKPRVKHYIDNGRLYEVFVEYAKCKRRAKRNKEPKPNVPKYVGECILMLCTRMAMRPNFNGYTHIDEMIGDGLENCVKAIDNFDPAKSKKNPFGYFSRIAWNAFIRRIQREQIQTYVKHKNFENMFLFEGLDGTDEQHDHEGANMMMDKFEKRIAAGREKTKTKKVKEKLQPAS